MGLIKPNTVTCPDCDKELKIPERFTKLGAPPRPIGNEESVLASHRGKLPCKAGINAKDAKARGLVLLDVAEGELWEPLQIAGVVEELETFYDSGSAGDSVRAGRRAG